MPEKKQTRLPPRTAPSRTAEAARPKRRAAKAPTAAAAQRARRTPRQPRRPGEILVAFLRRAVRHRRHQRRRGRARRVRRLDFGIAARPAAGGGRGAAARGPAGGRRTAIGAGGAGGDAGLRSRRRRGAAPRQRLRRPAHGNAGRRRRPLRGRPAHRAAAPTHPADYFFRSLAHYAGTSAIGVVLCGTEADGTVGLQEVKGAGGITIAQDPKTAVNDGAPRRRSPAARSTSCSPRADIAAELVRLASQSLPRRPARRRAPAATTSPTTAAATARRRRAPRPALRHPPLRHRRRLHPLQAADHPPPAAAADGAAQDRRPRRVRPLPPAEPRRGAGPLPGPADPRHALLPRPRVVRRPGRARSSPRSLDAPPARTRRSASGCPAARPARRRTRSRSRCWSTSATTARGTRRPDLRHRRQRAGRRAGPGRRLPREHRRRRLARAAAAVLHPGRREATGSARSVRDLCVFARQDLTRDPPFSRLDLIVCRNVLIYLGPVLQKRLMHVFHYALQPDGFPDARRRRRRSGLYTRPVRGRRQAAPDLHARSSASAVPARDLDGCAAARHGRRSRHGRDGGRRRRRRAPAPSPDGRGRRPTVAERGQPRRPRAATPRPAWSSTTTCRSSSSAARPARSSSRRPARPA